ncbi:MAG: hypothetical protein R3F07_01345 [Opitutaceae bacterium]
MKSLLDDLSPYIYGTTRLGDGKLAFEQRVSMARQAMDAGIWFHTSHQYGDALAVLRTAFDQDRSSVPKLIFKLHGGTLGEIRHSAADQTGAVGIDHVDLGQLCIGGALAEDLAAGGSCREGFRQLKTDGLVRRLVLEVFPWTSAAPLKALQGGHLDGVIDGVIFYLNPLQRFAANPLWDLLVERQFPIVAMRTVSGGPVHQMRDVPGFAWRDYLQKRAVEVAPIFERSGIKDWTEFSVRFAFSFPIVRATVGSTGRPEHLKSFLSAIGNLEPLPADIVAEIVALQRRWSDETDIQAEPWSM